MLKNKELDILNRYFNAANYLSVAELYLKDNPLLERPLEINDIKKKEERSSFLVVFKYFLYEAVGFLFGIKCCDVHVVAHRI